MIKALYFRFRPDKAKKVAREDWSVDSRRHVKVANLPSNLDAKLVFQLQQPVQGAMTYTQVGGWRFLVLVCLLSCLFLRSFLSRPSCCFHAFYSSHLSFLYFPRLIFQFCDALFEVTDMWTISIDWEEYVDFLGILYARISYARSSARSSSNSLLPLSLLLFWLLAFSLSIPSLSTFFLFTHSYIDPKVAYEAALAKEQLQEATDEATLRDLRSKVDRVEDAEDVDKECVV